MSNPFKGIPPLNPPTRDGKLINPLKNGEKVKRLRKHHAKQLKAIGLKPLQSPLK